MPVTTSYPGIYIEEIPSTSRTIAAAPTSIAVFIGYSHPFRGAVAENNRWGEAIRIFNFTEYERYFGGLFRSDEIPTHLPYAVQNFFLNGGSVAYVIGIKPMLTTSGVVGDYPNPSGDTGESDDIQFTGLEPVSSIFTLTVTLDNIQADLQTADLTVTYGSRAESFRKISLNSASENYINTRVNGVSALIQVAPGGANYGSFASATKKTVVLVSNVTAGSTVELSTGFTDAFDTDGSLDKVDIFNLMAIPGVSDAGVLAQALAFCEKKRAFYIVDPLSTATADEAPMIENEVENVPKSTNGAIYFPYVTSVDSLTGKSMSLPPSGHVAGVYARTDNNRGVWKAPAGLETILKNATGVVESGRMTEGRAGVLNDKGIDAIRTFPDIGTVVFGARTLVSANPAFQQWRYVPVRRMALFIEQTLYRNLGWAVFEPNDEPLWLAIRSSIERFMLSLFRQGAFQGSKPSEAFLVKCDSTTTTQTDIDNGIVNVLVGFCPLKPAEFVIIKIAQLAGQVSA